MGSPLFLQPDRGVLDIDAVQRRASDPALSVWVEASAGSGKTKVLADRVTRLLLSGVRPEKILCLTFTRAAAAEMSIRLTQRLSRWAICAESVLDDDLDALLGRPRLKEEQSRARRLLVSVLSCPGGMRLVTIHAFAQEILRRFPLEAGLSPTFTVLEEADARALQQETQQEVLKELARDKTDLAAAAFARLVRDMGESTIKGILSQIRSAMPRVRAALDRVGGLLPLIAKIRASLELEPSDTPEGFRQLFVREGAFDRGALLQGGTVILEHGSSSFKKGAAVVLDWLSRDEAERLAALEEYSAAFVTKEGDLRKSFANKAIVDAQPEIHDAFLAEGRRYLRLVERCESCAIAEETAAALTLGVRMEEAYEAAKTRRAALDFDDLIEKAAAVLSTRSSAAWVLYKLDGGIDHMLVDEAQDTNLAQWAIVEALAAEFFGGQGARGEDARTLFVVGDKKQSIYSFLKADPRVFDAKREAFETLIQGAEKPFAHVPFTVSFRSAPAVLAAVDAVFADPDARRGVAEMPVQHQAFRTDGAGRVELWPLFVPPEEERRKTRTKEAQDWQLPLSYLTAHNPAAALAAALAQQIKQWVESGKTVYDSKAKATRPMMYGDVLVLVQKRGTFVPQLVSAFKKIGVAVSGADRMRLTDQLAVMDLLALLQFALLPQDDLTLACVLRSPLIGASEEDVMRLAIGRGAKSLWARVAEEGSNFLEGEETALLCHSCLRQEASARQAGAREARTRNPICFPPPTKWDSGFNFLSSLPAAAARQQGRKENCSGMTKGDNKFAAIHAYLAQVMGWAQAMTPLALLMAVLSSPCPVDPISGRRAMTARLGADAEDPMDELLNAAETFSVRHAPALQAFLQWLMESETDVKREMEGAGACVRIMTVHGSKGLEAPVVVLPDAAYQPDRKRLPSLLWDEAENLPLYLPREPENSRMRALREAAFDRQMEEYRRLLYVGLTRAADRLYIGGFARDVLKEDATCWYGLAARTLAPLHRAELAVDAGTVIAPEIVIADDVQEQGGAARGRDDIKEIAQPPLPPWAFSAPAPEPSPPRPLIPSRPSEEESLEETRVLSPRDARFARGRIIHRLLQSLPALAPQSREGAARRYLASPQQALATAAQEEIAGEVLRLLDDPIFAPLFAEGSRAEVPIIGVSGQRLIAGQVDRLAVVGEEVWIVDYKTNRPPPADAAKVPDAYRRQLAAYQTVLEAIYPQRRIRCFLLWTHEARLMEIS